MLARLMLVYEHVELAPPNAAPMIERCVALSAQGSSSPAEALVGSAAAGVFAARNCGA